MGFLETLATKLAFHLADRVFDLLKERLETLFVYEQIYKKHDAKKNEMIEELMQANTDEERDAILSKIYNSRPTFD